MRDFFTLLPIMAAVGVLTLTACDPRPESKISGNEMLEMLGSEEGPEMTGIEQTLLESAMNSEKSKDYARALQFYTQLMDRNKANYIYKLGIAENLRRTLKLEDAVNYYDEVLKQKPKHIAALEGKGLALLGQTEFEEAGQILEEVLKIEPKRWRALNAMGILFVAKDMPQQAMLYYEEALGEKPDQPVVLNNIGLTLALNGDFERAVKALGRASKKLNKNDPQKKRANLNLALVHGIAGDIEQAERVAKPYLSESALNNNLGFYAYLAENDELAKGYLNNAISGSPIFYDKAWQNLEAIGGSQLKNKAHPPKVVEKPKSVPMVFDTPRLDKVELLAHAPQKTQENSLPASIVVDMARAVEPSLEPQVVELMSEADADALGRDEAKPRNEKMIKEPVALEPEKVALIPATVEMKKEVHADVEKIAEIVKAPQKHLSKARINPEKPTRTIEDRLFGFLGFGNEEAKPAISPVAEKVELTTQSIVQSDVVEEKLTQKQDVLKDAVATTLAKESMEKIQPVLEGVQKSKPADPLAMSGLRESILKSKKSLLPAPLIKEKNGAEKVKEENVTLVPDIALKAMAPNEIFESERVDSGADTFAEKSFDATSVESILQSPTRLDAGLPFEMMQEIPLSKKVEDIAKLQPAVGGEHLTTLPLPTEKVGTLSSEKKVQPSSKRASPLMVYSKKKDAQPVTVLEQKSKDLAEAAQLKKYRIGAKITEPEERSSLVEQIFQDIF